ncbi:uncharacterized protein DSM5745_01281 [Aspergillus mulundensis]|uniref:F-box domain-containing protein n=1 Tax=Aspergillus mulundensis TaxID=1810919 RepID=A0A3D8T600_9EURO|nr:hypothetical protein DSM5745_01281 [Aspergillus mulundensis]RDW93959.1 hypothetical protein DSM5745_01281 [Aspergillus mulundensis]
MPNTQRPKTTTPSPMASTSTSLLDLPTELLLLIAEHMPPSALIACHNTSSRLRAITLPLLSSHTRDRFLSEFQQASQSDSHAQMNLLYPSISASLRQPSNQTTEAEAEAEAEVDHAFSTSVLHAACTSTNTPIIYSLIIHHGLNYNTRAQANNPNSTALTTVMANPNTAALRTLIALGADLAEPFNLSNTLSHKTKYLHRAV